MIPRIAEDMKKPYSRFITMRDQGSREVASVVQWTIPSNGPEDTAKTETAEDAEERQEMGYEAYRKRLLENSNKDLIMEFEVQTEEDEKQALGRSQALLTRKPSHTHPNEAKVSPPN